MANNPFNPSADASVQAGRGNRLWSIFGAAVASARKHPFTAFIGGGAILAGVLAAVVVWLWQSQQQQQTVNTLAVELLDTLDRQDYAEAKRLAITMHQLKEASYEDLGVAAYVLGIVSAQEAETTLEAPKRKKLFLVSARFLEESHLRGFPPGRSHAGLSALGKSLFEIGHYSACRPALLAAINQQPRQTGKMRRLLADAYLLDEPPQIPEALKHLQQYLAEPELTEAERHAGLAHQGRMLLAQKDLAGCRQAVASIPEDSPAHAEALLVLARAALLEGDQLVAAHTPENAATQFEQARQYLEAVKMRTSATSRPASEASFLLGSYFERIGNLEQALRQFHETRRQNFMSPIAIPAGLSEAELLRRFERHDEALTVYSRLLSETGNAETYANRWVPLEELRVRTRLAYTDFLDAGKFQLAVDLAQALGEIFPAPESYRWQAEARSRWAGALAERAKTDPLDQRQALRAESRHQSRVAARLFEHLANINMSSPNYVDDLASSADHYMRGNEFRDAVRMFGRYVNNVSRSKLPPAQISLGRAYLALGKPEDALKPLLNCIQLNTASAEVYEARLIASIVYQELNDGDNAKRLLLANIDYDPNTDPLRPESIEWRDSLLQLGKVFYQEGQTKEAESRRLGSYRPTPSKESLAPLEASYAAFQEAILRLEEFVDRHEVSGFKWAEPFQYMEARYLLADSHRHAAKFPRRKLAVVTIGTTRASLTRQIQEDLSAAERIYAVLETDLWKIKSERDPTKLEQTMMRNSVFGRADVLFDLERYEEAIEVYTTAANRYQKRPEALEAYLQIADCYRRLDQADKAPAFLNRARSVLEQQIDKDADFSQTTRFDRDQWNDLLDWLTRLYQSEGLGA